MIKIFQFLTFLFIFNNTRTQIFDLNINGQNYQLNWQKDLQTKQTTYFLIDILLNEKTIGSIYYQLKHEDKSIYISKFWIHPSARQNRIGKHILIFVCDLMTKTSQEISLDAAPFELSGIEYKEMLPRLIAYYKECGFDGIENSSNLFYSKHKKELFKLFASSRLHSQEILGLMLISKL